MSNEKELPTMPDWSTAPEWAMWRCIDYFGNLEYHELEPKPQHPYWVSDGLENVFGYGFDSDNWRKSLQKRPE